jgi:hypothetical protein
MTYLRRHLSNETTGQHSQLPYQKGRRPTVCEVLPVGRLYYKQDNPRQLTCNTPALPPQLYSIYIYIVNMTQNCLSLQCVSTVQHQSYASVLRPSYKINNRICVAGTYTGVQYIYRCAVLTATPSKYTGVQYSQQHQVHIQVCSTYSNTKYIYRCAVLTATPSTYTGVQYLQQHQVHIQVCSTHSYTKSTNERCLLGSRVRSSCPPYATSRYAFQCGQCRPAYGCCNVLQYWRRHTHTHTHKRPILQKT